MGSALLLLATFVGVNAWSKLKRDEMEERRAGFDVMTTMTLDAWRPSSPPLVAGDLLENHIVIVHFWAPWNAQDREIDVALTAFASRRNVCLRSCNVDDVENQQFAEDVANIPYLKIYVRGEAKAAYVGRWTTDALEELLENAQSGEQV